MKKNKGISLIVFIIVIAVLIILAACIIVYLIKNPVKEKTAVQNPAIVTETNSSSEVKQKYTSTLTDAQNGKTAFLELETKGEFQTEKHDGYYTYVDPFDIKYNIKEIKDVVSEKGIMGVNNWAALFKVTVTYSDNNNKTKTMELAILLQSTYEIQCWGTYENYTGSTNYAKNFTDLYSKTEETENSSMTADEKFSAYVSNYKKEMKNKIVGTLEGETYASSIIENVSFEEYENDGSSTGIQNHQISLSSDGKLKIDNNKIAENIFNYKVLQIGSNRLHYIVFVKEDGAASYMRISKLKTMSNDSVHEIKNVNYIIGILGTIDTYEVGLIDIEGNIIKVNI